MPREAKPPLIRKVTPQSLENSALFYLQRYAASAAQLKRVLMRRVLRSAEAHESDPAEGAAWVEALLVRYRQSGLLDDAAFAEAKTASLRRRGGSARAIRATLRAKGVEAELVDAALESAGADTENPELDAARAFARRRRLGPWRPEATREAYRLKDMAAMARAGFGFEVARRALDEGGE